MAFPVGSPYLTPPKRSIKGCLLPDGIPELLRLAGVNVQYEEMPDAILFSHDESKRQLAVDPRCLTSADQWKIALTLLLSSHEPSPEGPNP